MGGHGSGCWRMAARGCRPYGTAACDALERPRCGWIAVAGLAGSSVTAVLSSAVPGCLRPGTGPGSRLVSVASGSGAEGLQERGPRHWRGDRPAGLGVGVADTCALWVLPHRVPAERRAPADEVGHGPDEHCVIAAAGGRVRGLAGVDLRPGPVGVGPVIDIDADLVDIAVAGIAALGAPGGQVADPEGRLQ